MAWRGLHLTRPARLSFADGQAVIDQEDGEARLALEDLAWIVLDSPRCTLTGNLLSACMNAGIAIIVTDERHTPSGVALPFHRHHRQGEVARLQVAMSAPLRKRLWQTIVRRKIDNQAAVLDRLERDGEPLRAMAGRVGSGDPDNVEARAARAYWSLLWSDFRREDAGDLRNMLINYGYAVVRSGVARALVAVGLLPALGLKHAGAANAFNLADDLFEPFRPFVDLLAWRAVGEGKPCRGDLSVEDRRAMAAALLTDARLGADTVTLLVAAERGAESLVRSIENASAGLLELPALPA
jgi:CRISPR-associated protein Cas1